MNTNQTNGSPFEDAADQSGLDLTESLSSQQIGSRDMTEGISAETGQPQARQRFVPIPPSRSALGDASAGGDDAKHSVEGVSSIQKLVHAVESTGVGYVDEASDMESRDSGAVEFRVTCSGSPVRRLRLTGDRYTFGSAEGCSIRLSDDTLRPMHAVMLRDASRVIVRAYSVPVQVNASRTTEANLQVGDVLRLGQYQFELLSVKSAEMKSSSGSQLATQTGECTSAGDDGRSSSTSELLGRSPKAGHEPRSSSFSAFASEDTSTGGHTAEDTLWRDRLRQEVDQWRERQIECDRREGRMDERETELRNRETELWSRAENLNRREARLQSQETSDFQLHDEFSQRQRELLAVREENHLRGESYPAHEVELHEQELPYRSQLEEATRRLQQSQQQAESAAESLAQMREQVESLNAQVERLSHQHLEIEEREQKQRVEHERLQAGLEQARDQAVQDHADSENRCVAAEKQAAKLEEQIAQLRVANGSSESEQLAQLSESEAAESLSQQVEELQQMVSDARNEAEVLRADHEQACSSVRELENIVSESEGRDDENREQRIAETSELRSALEKLSSAMDQSNSELNQLREANEDLTRRLTEVKQERDQARLDLESRPSQEEFASIQFQLESANERIATMQFDHEQTLVRLEAAEQQKVHRQSSDEPSANQADAVWEQIGNIESDNAACSTVEESSGKESGHQTVGVSESNAGVEPNQDAIPDSGNPSLGECGVGSPNPTLQAADSLHMHSENEMRDEGVSYDRDQMVGGSLTTKLNQDLESADESADDGSSSNECSSDGFLSGAAAADCEVTDSDDKHGTVEAYINRLLQRVRGDAGGKSSEGEASDDASDSQEESLEPLDSNVPLAPALLVPEGDLDLNAMHELANVSARVAIKCRTPLRARNIQVTGVIRLVYALGAIGCGAVCFVLFTGIPTYVISVMAGVVAAIYIREAMQLFQEADYQYSAGMNGLHNKENDAAGNDDSADD